ncbi:MAG: amidohydrolase [Pseudomonadales bacterium]
MKVVRIFAFFVLFPVVGSSCSGGQDKVAQQPSGQQVTLETIYFGGDILTMEGSTPEYVDAIGVANGKISFVGDTDAAMIMASNTTKTVDLAGKTLIPGFIDSHSHFLLTAVKLATVNLDPPPAGTVRSVAGIVESMRTELQEGTYDDENWLFGWGYDTAMLVDGRHPTKADLDLVSNDIPIALLHFSTHMVVANSRALDIMGIDEKSVAPEGGVIRRMPNSMEPNGVLEEQAIYPVFERLGDIGKGDRLVTLLDSAQELYVSNGFTTALEFGATPRDITSIKSYAASGKLKIDLIAAIIAASQGAAETAKVHSNEYLNHFRIAGGKINLDGGTPGRTAYLRDPYHTQEEGMPNDYRGYSSIERQEDLNAIIQEFYKRNVPIFIHALGDAAIDQAIVAIQSAQGKFPREDIRTQLIHLQVLREDQLETLEDLDVTLTFQNTHNFYFADFHNEVTLGPERTNKLNPLKSALEHGFSVTFHHDSPVHPVDSLGLIWIATNRAGRSGTVYGIEERLTPYQALYALTMAAAFQFFEEDKKGSLTAGKLADLLILSDNPLKIDRGKIRDIKVIETIKAGKTIYVR